LQASVKSSVSRPHNPAGDNDGIKNCINCPAPSVCRLLQQNRHEAEMSKYLGDVRCWVNSGSHLLALSISEFDPTRTSAVPAPGGRPICRKAL
jgi:hypothetical protein